MVSRIQGGSPAPLPQTDAADSKGAVESKDASQTETQSTSAATDSSQTQVSTAVDSTAQRAEHSLAGQAAAAGLQAMVGAAKDAAKGSAPASDTPRLLKQPDKGPDVEELQNQVNEWRANNGKDPIKVDGKFGPETAKAVHEFQKSTGLSNDGVVGPNTRDRLKVENDANFQKLDPDTQKQIRDGLNSYQKDPASRENLTRLATDPNLANLSKEGQNDAIQAFKTDPKNPANTDNVLDNAKDRAYLESHSNFQKLNPDTKQQVLDQFKKYSNDSIARSNLVNIATDGNFAKLSRPLQDQVLKTYDKNPTVEGGDSLRRLMNNDGFDKMDDALKGRVMDMASKNVTSPDYKKDLAKLLENDRFASMSNADKTKALNVFDNTTPAGRAAFQDLLAKNVNGKPALESKDKNGATLLDNLDRLSNGTIDSRITNATGGPQDKTKVTEDLLKELSKPNENINQDNRGTCTVTSMTDTLANKNPAEYARICTDLSLTGQSKLANGDTITPPADGFAQDNSNRSVSERLLQSSLMNYARPGGGYQNWNAGPDGVRGTTDDGFPDATNPTAKHLDGYPPNGGGLTAQDNMRVMAALNGKSYDRFTDKIQDRTAKAIADGKGPVFTGVKWGPGGNHALEVMKIENGRVYYRNPWGPGAVGPNGSVHGTSANNTNAGPLRQTEDSANGIESMSVADYNKIVNDIIVEK